MSTNQIEFGFVQTGSEPATAPPSVNELPKPVRHLQPYKCTESDRRVRRKVKLERGSRCERCGKTAKPEQLSVHHILETRIFPEFAREPLNMFILCAQCHSAITSGEGFATSSRALFYVGLPPAIRSRHVDFLAGVPDISPALLSAFRDGNPEHRQNRFVADWTK